MTDPPTRNVCSQVDTALVEWWDETYGRAGNKAEFIRSCFAALKIATETEGKIIPLRDFYSALPEIFDSGV